MQHKGALRFGFYISDLFNMAVGMRQSIKKQFPSYYKVFHHLTSRTQSEQSSPLIFHEQKTTHVGMLTPETQESFVSLARRPERPLQ